jgi:hypothetical protein
MAFKLIESAQGRSRAVTDHLVALVRAGAVFKHRQLIQSVELP